MHRRTHELRPASNGTLSIRGVGNPLDSAPSENTTSTVRPFGTSLYDPSPDTSERRGAHGAWAVTETCPGHNYGNHDNHQDESSDENSAGFHTPQTNRRCNILGVICRLRRPAGTWLSSRKPIVN